MSNVFVARAGLALAAIVNLVPLGYTGLFLTPGTAAGGGDDARLTFIAAHATEWSAGWLMWMGGSLGLALSVWMIARVFELRAPHPGLLRLATVVAAIGAGIDVVGDAIQVTTFPTLAHDYTALAPGDPARTPIVLLFDLVDHLATALSGGVANTLYFVAGIAVVIALAQMREFPGWITALGIVAWLVTLAATPAIFFPHIVPVAVAAAIFLYVAWLGVVAVWGLPGVKPRFVPFHLLRV